MNDLTISSSLVLGIRAEDVKPIKQKPVDIEAWAKRSDLDRLKATNIEKITLDKAPMSKNDKDLRARDSLVLCVS
jgi:hypothetical protein